MLTYGNVILYIHVSIDTFLDNIIWHIQRNLALLVLKICVNATNQRKEPLSSGHHYLHIFHKLRYD